MCATSLSICSTISEWTKTATNGPADELMKLMAEYKDTQELRNKLARMLGNDIVV